MDSTYREMAAVFLPAFRRLMKDRKSPQAEYSVFYTRSTGKVELFCTLFAGNPRSAVVVAHPAIVGSCHAQVLGLAHELSSAFSVILFDFRGHGRSGGRCPLGFSAVSEDLEVVVDRTRLMGFERIGVAGMSLGAAAAFLLASRRRCFDSLVSIGCPPRFPELGPAAGLPLLSRASLRALGMRVDPSPDGGPEPADVAPVLPPIPKLLIFGEWEVAPADDIAAFAESVPGPKRVMTIPGVWHADLGGREAMVREWFEETL